MKSTIAILVCLFALCASAENDELLQKWQEYQIQFGKSYRSPVESRRRFSIFTENLATIEAHNTLYENGEETHSMGINQFTDWTSEEFMAYVNKGLLNKPPRLENNFFNSTEDLEDAPEPIDWRNLGGVSPVKDQGSCGSCWAFSAVGAIESKLLLEKACKTTLSEQQLVDCSSRQGNQGCEGGLMDNAYVYVMSKGLESDKDYPYTGVDGVCKYERIKTESKVTVRAYVPIDEGDEERLVKILVKGPVSIAIDATSALQLYSGGILKDNRCSSYSLNHGVLLVGWGRENGQEYYVIKNSWGKNWGEKGFFRLAKGGNRCGVASMATYILFHDYGF